MTEYAYKMRMVVACNEVTERERERGRGRGRVSMIQTLSTQQVIHRTMLWVSRLWICVCHIFINDVESTSQIWRVSLTCSDSDIFQWFETFRNYVKDLPCEKSWMLTCNGCGSTPSMFGARHHQPGSTTSWSTSGSIRRWTKDIPSGELTSCPSGELTFCRGKWPFLMGKTTISMAIFNCYVSSPEGRWWNIVKPG